MTAAELKEAILRYVRENFPASKGACVTIDTGESGVSERLVILCQPAPRLRVVLGQVASASPSGRRSRVLRRHG